MHINGFKVFLACRDNEVWVSFDKYAGTLREMIAFRKSFDYECYRFGNGCFNSATWKTIIADDKKHQSYPRKIGLSSQDGEISISWTDFENLLSFAREFAAKNLT